MQAGREVKSTVDKECNAALESYISNAGSRLKRKAAKLNEQRDKAPPSRSLSSSTVPATSSASHVKDV